jgi:hypothetical protein
MAKKSQKPAAQTSEPPAKNRGRLPTNETLMCFWYRDVEGFEKCDVNPWWGVIEWDDEIKAKKAKRSLEHGKAAPRTVLAGFLWETIRRLPEFPTLMEEFRRLNESECDEKLPLSEQLNPVAQAQRAFVGFLGENGVLVIEALKILSKGWKLCFESLPQESKDRWEGCYLALWNKVGDPGSVPAAPAELPAIEPLEYWGQGRTAFDLLIKHPGGSLDGYRVYEDHPLPTLFLRAFAKLRSSKGTDEDLLDPHPDFTKGETEPCTYPWLSFGILEQHLAKYHLHPLALAVDLSKSTEMIVRDLRQIIGLKRQALGIAVADRRIKKESFDKIKALDQGVFGSSDTPLLAKTVREFKASARLSLNNLIYQMGLHVDCDKPSTPQMTQPVSKEVRQALDDLKRQAKSKKD